jgi:hypothetical protein
MSIYYLKKTIRKEMIMVDVVGKCTGKDAKKVFNERVPCRMPQVLSAARQANVQKSKREEDRFFADEKPAKVRFRYGRT